MTPNEQQPVQAPAPASRYAETMRAIFAAFSHHGKPLRGLMSTAKSPSFQGRFGRMFRSLPPATYGKTDAESRARLMELGKAMTSSFDPPKDGFDAEESGIPALYTYFGQFVDHDITFDPMTTLIQQRSRRSTDFDTRVGSRQRMWPRSGRPAVHAVANLSFCWVTDSIAGQTICRATTPTRAGR